MELNKLGVVSVALAAVALATAGCKSRSSGAGAKDIEGDNQATAETNTEEASCATELTAADFGIDDSTDMALNEPEATLTIGQVRMRLAGIAARVVQIRGTLADLKMNLKRDGTGLLIPTNQRTQLQSLIGLIDRALTAVDQTRKTFDRLCIVERTQQGVEVFQRSITNLGMLNAATTQLLNAASTQANAAARATIQAIDNTNLPAPMVPALVLTEMERDLNLVYGSIVAFNAAVSVDAQAEEQRRAASQAASRLSTSLTTWYRSTRTPTPAATPATP